MLGGDLKCKSRYLSRAYGTYQTVVDHLDTKGHFPESVVRFWAAELASGLVYLHSKGIMHRCASLNFLWSWRLTSNSNINSWNILLDAKGHAALTDLKTATHYSQDRMHTSVVGLIGHMAPEMVDEKRPGYSWQVDWWSLGVCLFELLWNQYPFQVVGGTEEKLRDDIMTLPITIPSQSHGAVSSECTAALLGVSRDGRSDGYSTDARLDFSFSSETRRSGWVAERAPRALKRYSLTAGSCSSIGRSCKRSSSIHRSRPTSVHSRFYTSRYLFSIAARRSEFHAVLRL